MRAGITLQDFAVGGAGRLAVNLGLSVRVLLAGGYVLRVLAKGSLHQCRLPTRGEDFPLVQIGEVLGHTPIFIHVA